MALVTILEEQALAFTYDEAYGAYTNNSNPSLFLPVVGETYSVIWDGTEYVCTAKEADTGAIRLGNMVAFGGEDTGEPFVMGSLADGSGMTIYCYSGESHTVAIYKKTSGGGSSETLTTIFEEQTLEFVDQGEGGSGPWGAVADAPIAFVVGETYRVVWDGAEYECVASELAIDGVLYPPLIGNPSALGGEDNGVPFAIMYASAEMTGTTAMYSMIAFDAATTHTVGIYQVTSDDDTGGEEEGGDGGTEEEQEGIILKDRNGNDVAYYDIETLTLDTTTEGKQQKYTKGVKAEKTVELSLADGDQTVEPDEGTLLSKVIIQRPDSLQPEIILSGHEVAGVPGAYVPITTEEKTVDLDFSAGDMTVEAESGKAFSEVSIPVPETLVPENIAEGIDVAGIIGTLAASGGGNVVCASGTIYRGTAGVATITHNLGVVPDLVVLIVASSFTPSASSRVHAMYAWGEALWSKMTKDSTAYPQGALSGTKSSMSFNSRTSYLTSSDGYICNATETTFETASVYFGGTVRWFAIGGLT